MGWNKLENNVKGQLATGINAAVTAMDVNLLAGSKSYPAGIDVDNPMYLTISSATNPLSNEIVKVTAHTGANVTTMVRGQRGTVAAIWPADAVVSLNLHAEDMEGIQAFVGSDGTYTGNVTGNLSGNVTGNVDGDLSGSVVLDAGTAALPSASFTGDPNTGFYHIGADHIGASTNGVLRLSISTTAITAAIPFLAPAGSAAAPSVSFSGDPDSGLYSKAANQIGAGVNGAEVGYIASTGWNGAVVGNVTGNLSGNVTGDITGSIVLAAGTEALPSLAITGDLNTGMWSSGADALDWSTGGTKRLTLSTTALTSTLPIAMPDGSAAAPSIYRAADSNLGMYFAANQVRFSAQGVSNCYVDRYDYGALDFESTWAGGKSTSPIFKYVSGFNGYSFSTSGLPVVGKLHFFVQKDVAATEAYSMDYAEALLTRSGADWDEITTVYNEGALHINQCFRAARGTSGTPDYLDTGDAIGSLKFEARDGAGTWGDGVELRATATANHGSGETPAQLSIYATELESDTQTHIANFGMYRILPGAGDLDLALMDGRGLAPLTLGGNWMSGYLGDVNADYSGFTLIDWSAGYLAIMLDTDNQIYFGTSVKNVKDDETWRIGDDGSAGFVTSQYDSSGQVWENHFRVSENGAEVDAAGAFYMGDPDTDGTWRTGIDSADYNVSKRVSNAYVDMFHHDGDTLVLDKTVYNDANVGSLVLQTGGTLPGVVQLVDNLGVNTGIYTRGFADGEQGSGSIEIPHDYKEGTDLVFHVHWNAQAAPSGTDYVKWNLIYTITRDGSTIAPVATVPSEIAVDTQYKNYRSDFTAITGTNYKIGDQFNFTLARATAAGDAYAGEAAVFTIGFHYQCDTLGSRSISAK